MSESFLAKTTQKTNLKLKTRSNKHQPTCSCSDWLRLCKISKSLLSLSRWACARSRSLRSLSTSSLNISVYKKSELLLIFNWERLINKALSQWAKSPKKQSVKTHSFRLFFLAILPTESDEINVNTQTS